MSTLGIALYRWKNLAATAAVSLAISTIVRAETVGLFFDPAVEQIKFAAGDVKAALEKNKFTVEMLQVSALNVSYANKKVVVALASNTTASAVLAAQGGSEVAGLGEQAYGLRTTETPHKSYWVLGGDVNGKMYGGLQIAENIRFKQFTGNYNNGESPAILKRGIKFYLPLDKKSATYETSSKLGDSAEQAIPHVWDIAFWTEWFDTMARNRYNVVSVWNNHPFTSMIKMADYPDVAIQNVTGYDGYSKELSIDEKIMFWQKVMAYAHSRSSRAKRIY